VAVSALTYIFQKIFAEVENIEQDFEVKKFMLGLSRFIDPNVPAEVQD